MRYVYVRDGYHFEMDFWSYVGYVAILTAWPWVALYVVRWIVDRFQNG